MVLNGLLKTADYRGDHSADIMIAMEVKEDMTIKELIESIERYHNPTPFNNGKDHIEIRVIKELNNE